MGFEDPESRHPITYYRQVGEVAVVRFHMTQVLDELKIFHLGEELQNLVNEAGFSRIVISFENVHFLGSGVVGKILALNERIIAEKGRLALCCICDDIYRVFEITKVNSVIPILATEEEAVQKVS